MSVADLYNFKAEIEPAIGRVLEANAIQFLDTQDPQAFQKPRARVEVMFILGAGKQEHLAMSEVTGLECDVEDAWDATVNLSLITASDPAIHGAYEAQIRYVMQRLPPLINGVVGGIMNHVVYGPVRHLASTETLKSEDGFYTTEMQFAFSVSIHETAWSLLSGTGQYRYYSEFGANWRQSFATGATQVFGYLGDSLWHTVIWDSATGRFVIDEQGQS